MSEPNMSLDELAGRVEKLTGPCRETDAAIGLATGRFFLGEPRYPGAARMYGYVDENGSRVEPGNGSHDSLIPRYTASIDAAMTLADAADDPLDILEEALATAREERDGIYFLPLHICAAALKSLAEKGRP